jgi:hypothetical protein
MTRASDLPGFDCPHCIGIEFYNRQIDCRNCIAPIAIDCVIAIGLSIAIAMPALAHQRTLTLSKQRRGKGVGLCFPE